MGSTRLDYEVYLQDIDYWNGEKCIAPPKWADELYQKGFKPMCAVDFYEDVFGDGLAPDRSVRDYRKGEYSGIVAECKLIDTEITDTLTEKQEKALKKRYMEAIDKKLFFDDKKNLFDMIDRSENFVIVAPLSYAGKSKFNKNIRRMFALTLEIDDIQEENGIDELVYSWERENSPLPKPTYIVCSGTGLHLYYVFEYPLPIFPSTYEELSRMKYYFLERFWNKYITKAYDKQQRAGAGQCFRAVGSATKRGNQYVMAFKVGDKVTIDYLNGFVEEDTQKVAVYKPHRLSREKAKELYPEWYQRRVVEKKPSNTFTRYEGIYYDWIKKIKSGAVVGRRFFCLENLCSLAKQCCISPEQLEKDCKEVATYLETLTVSPKNHFTQHDIMCAMATYRSNSPSVYTRKIEYIAERTGIPLVRNKRNHQTQAEHLEEARAIRDIRCKRKKKKWTDGNGRKPKELLVMKWRKKNPNGTKAACVRELGLDKKTVYKWWGEI